MLDATVGWWDLKQVVHVKQVSPCFSAIVAKSPDLQQFETA